MKITYWLFLSILLLTIVGCSSDQLDVDISDIETNMEVKRFDVDFFSCEPGKLTEYIPEMTKKYGGFYEFYNENILQMGSGDKQYESSLFDFYKYCDEPLTRSLKSTCGLERYRKAGQRDFPILQILLPRCSCSRCLHHFFGLQQFCGCYR